MRRLRIAVYHNLSSGGAKRVAAEHLERLARRHEVVLFSHTGADHCFAQESATAYATVLASYRPWPWLHSPFGRLNTLIGMANFARLDKIARVMAAAIDAQRFDVVLAHPCQISQSPLVLRWLRTSTLYYCQELPRLLYEPPISRPYQTRSRAQRALDRIDPLPALCLAYYRAMDRAAARNASCIVVNSYYTAANVQRAYGHEATVCYQGVNSQQFAPGKSGRERIVLSVGALTPSKGFDTLIEAIATLPPGQRPPLVLISNFAVPQERQFLEGLAAERGVSLTCLINIAETELREWYARAGCIAYAPVREPFGLVALEAMAAGVPLVAVAEGGVTETVIDGETGVLTPREPMHIGQAILRLLDRSDEALSLGTKARAYVREHWTWDRHIEQLEQLLQELAGRGMARLHTVSASGLHIDLGRRHP